MRSEAATSLTGYRQPAQARVFGHAAVIVVALASALLLSIRLTTPIATAIDAGKTASFVAESIPLERPEQSPQPAPADPALTTAPAPPSPVREAPAPSPRSPAPVAPVIGSLPGTFVASPAAGASGSVTVDTFPPAPSAPAAPAAPPPIAPAATAAADWRARLLGHLKRYRRYPRQAGSARQQGIAHITITLRRSGEVVAAELVRGSGYPLLDMEARATVRRASPLPPPDEAILGDPVTVEVPIDFALRR